MIGIIVDKEIRDLLPWYVNGTLRGVDRDRVEAALRNDPSINSVLHWEQAVQQAVQNDPALEIAEDRGLANVMHRIRSEIKPAPQPARKAAPRLFEWFKWSPAMALACGIVVAQFGIIVHMYQVRGEESAYSDVRTVAGKRTEAFVRVTFKSETTESELRTLLHDLHAEIVSGPSQLGDYYLIVKSKAVQSTLTTLQSSSHVESAEIVNALPSRAS